jgi:hypothetical protein
LETARKGAGVDQPICWIAPDIEFNQAREYLEKYRIRVIPYDNRDGTHSNLIRIIENINQFVYPRTAIKIKKEIEAVSVSPLGRNAAAPGFFVFTKIAERDDFDLYRADIVCAAIQSIIPKLKLWGEFSLENALHLAGLID